MKYDLNNKYKLQLAEEYFQKLKKEGAFIDLKKVKQKRSLDQNALYWLWLTVIEVETGHFRNESHLLYRAMFLRKDETKIRQIIIPDLWEKVRNKIDFFQYFKGLEDIINIISLSTTDLETDSFTNYLEKIRDHAKLKMDVTLLTQDEQAFEDFYKEYYKL